jgi:hypothetical protein
MSAAREEPPTRLGSGTRGKKVSLLELHVRELNADDARFLYALFIALDANFRLKRKDVSSEEKDPGLGNGWAFFCKVKAYMAHVKRNWHQKQDVRPFLLFN